MLAKRLVSLRGNFFGGDVEKKLPVSLFCLLSPSVCCHSPSLSLPRSVLLAFLAFALRFTPAIALRALSLAFIIGARGNVTCLRYRRSSCLQCRCTRSMILPTSGLSILLCRTGLWREKRSSPTATKHQMLHATPMFAYMTTAPSAPVLYTLLQ